MIFVMIKVIAVVSTEAKFKRVHITNSGFEAIKPSTVTFFCLAFTFNCVVPCLLLVIKAFGGSHLSSYKNGVSSPPSY